MCKNIFLYVFVAYPIVPKDKRNYCFSVGSLRPVFEKVKFAVRRSLEHFKDFDGSFLPSSTAPTKRSQTFSNALKRSPTVHMFLIFFSDSVQNRLWPRRVLLLRYTTLLSYTQLCCKSTFLSKRKFTNGECCMVNLVSWSLNEGQMN